MVYHGCECIIMSFPESQLRNAIRFHNFDSSSMVVATTSNQFLFYNFSLLFASISWALSLSPSLVWIEVVVFLFDFCIQFMSHKCWSEHWAHMNDKTNPKHTQTYEINSVVFGLCEPNRTMQAMKRQRRPNPTKKKLSECCNLLLFFNLWYCSLFHQKVSVRAQPNERKKKYT